MKKIFAIKYLNLTSILLAVWLFQMIMFLVTPLASIGFGTFVIFFYSWDLVIENIFQIMFPSIWLTGLVALIISGIWDLILTKLILNRFAENHPMKVKIVYTGLSLILWLVCNGILFASLERGKLAL